MRLNKNKKSRNIIGVTQSVLIFVLVVLVVIMMIQIDRLQGTARVINYAGLVRGATQREVKLEIAGSENDELIEMLGLEKSLVYFSTSLKSDEVTLNKIMRGKQIQLYEEDEDLLEDVMIEIHQAIEMCNIYSNTMAGTMDTFASIISNNMNIVMNKLTVITIVMAIPNIIFGFYGMNVQLPFPFVWFPSFVAILACVVATVYFFRHNMFK